MTKIYNYRAKRRFSLTYIIGPFFFIFIFFVCVSVLPNLRTSFSTQAEEIISPISLDINPVPGIPDLKPSTNTSTLEQIIQEELSNKDGNYSIVVQNLKTKEQYLLNEHAVYEAASLYKLWVMATTYDLMKDAEINDTAVLSSDIATLNRKFNIDPENAELTEGSISLSVNKAIYQMITISHNYAALLLTTKIKLSTVKTFLINNSFLESELGTANTSPSTTASDIALFFEKMYHKTLVNEEYSDRMITTLKAQQLNEKIPKYLSKSIQVAHKTGEIGPFSHDAGIIYSPQGDYIFVILTETDTPAKTNEVIAKISQKIYRYFSE